MTNIGHCQVCNWCADIGSLIVSLVNLVVKQRVPLNPGLMGYWVRKGRWLKLPIQCYCKLHTCSLSRLMSEGSANKFGTYDYRVIHDILRIIYHIQINTNYYFNAVNMTTWWCAQIDIFNGKKYNKLIVTVFMLQRVFQYNWLVSVQMVQGRDLQFEPISRQEVAVCNIPNAISNDIWMLVSVMTKNTNVLVIYM